MSLRLRRTRMADADLDSIWLYIATDSIAAAERQVQSFERAERRLAEFPELGPARPDLRPGLRSWTVGAYLILYRIDPDALPIVRVLHGARDLRALFGS
jgi:toxin ParE1/3/4